MREERQVVRICSGDIFESGAQALVNPVNCVGTMGAGLALAFKRRYRIFGAYQVACATGKMKPGHLVVCQIINPPDSTEAVICFPTKRHWRDDSRIEDIEAGLKSLVRVIQILPIKSIAIPALGCGYGGLEWKDVRPLVEHHLRGLDCQVMVFGPK